VIKTQSECLTHAVNVNRSSFQSSSPRSGVQEKDRAREYSEVVSPRLQQPRSAPLSVLSGAQI
jgi:hypothetical protein